MRRLITLAAGLLVAGCTKAEQQNTPAAGAAPPSSATTTMIVDTTTMTRLPTGIHIKDLVVGGGAEARAGQRVSVHYVGQLMNGRQFDANGANDPPMQFVLGAGQMIGGFDQGVTGMRIGGRRQVVIPPSLGYGPNDYGPIPGNSTLVFTIELVAAQ